MMKILYVSQYFPPEMGAPSARVYELSKHWVQAGHEVSVLTGFPNHPTGRVPLEYRRRMRRLVSREQVDGIDVVRTWLLPRPNRYSLERVLNYTSFWLSSSLSGIFLSKPDVVIGTSPQLLAGLTSWWLGQAKEIPSVLEVRDLWPESLVASGVGNEESITTKLVGGVARFLYEHCDHIVVVTPAFKERLQADWGVAPEKCSIVNNGVETELFTPSGDIKQLKEKFGIGNKFVVSYIGTFGLAHGLDIVLDAAEHFQEIQADIMFMLVGEGAEREHLNTQVRSRGLHNVKLFPQQPKSEVPSYIQASDVCMVLLRKAETFRTVIPTKMLEFMSCGRPIVLGVDGQARAVMEEADAGLFIEPENAEALVAGLKQLQRDKNLRERLGRNGRRHIVDKLSREVTADHYIDVLKEIVGSYRREAL